MKRAVLIIFALWGTLAFLNAIYPWLRAEVVAVASRKPDKPAEPAPYTAADRARDAARAERLQREAKKDPNLNRLLEERREMRARGINPDQ